jgi:hypothetical protein
LSLVDLFRVLSAFAPTFSVGFLTSLPQPQRMPAAKGFEIAMTATAIKAERENREVGFGHLAQ